MAVAECAGAGVHDAVKRRLARLHGGRLLDAPAGHGALASWAHGAGWDVTPGDLDPANFTADGLACTRLDLNERLPFEDATFDAISCVEGIEHVEQQFGLVRELRRVLRPGGTLILTTPNVGSLGARVRYALTGLFPLFDFDWTLRDWGHITPISLPELALALDRAGFKIRSIGHNRLKPQSLILAPLALPIWLATRKAVGPDRLKRLLLSRSALFGEVVVIEAN